MDHNFDSDYHPNLRLFIERNGEGGAELPVKVSIVRRLKILCKPQHATPDAICLAFPIFSTNGRTRSYLASGTGYLSQKSGYYRSHFLYSTCRATAILRFME